MLSWLEDDVAERRRRGLFRVRRRVQTAPGVRIRCGGRELLNFASNDYLNLAADPRLARAAARATRRYGCGAGSSPLVSGYLKPHRDLERDLARWEETEAALLFSSGFAANVGAISALLGPDDAVFSDELNHASLIDGSRLSRARIHVYRHADAEHLRDLLCREGPAARRRLIVTDTVFSMDGDFAPVADLYELAERYDCLLLVDEAHATGVVGERGCGVTELYPPKLDPDRLIKVGTLSKALAAQGGFVCGSRRMIDYLVNHARPYIFSTALTPSSAAAARRALVIVQRDPESRRRLQAHAEQFRDELRAIGYPQSCCRCQIVPVVLGDARAAVELSQRLEESGILAPAIRPPSVPEGQARLRISLTAGHTEADLGRLVRALHEARRSVALA